MQCVGTSTNLKHRFGRGFKLTVNQAPAASVREGHLTSALRELDMQRDEGGESSEEGGRRAGKMGAGDGDGGAEDDGPSISAHDALRAFVEHLAPGSVVLSHLNGTTHFAIPAAALSVETAFVALEAARGVLAIDDWGIQV